MKNSVCPENVQKYTERLNYWEEQRKLYADDVDIDSESGIINKDESKSSEKNIVEKVENSDIIRLGSERVTINSIELPIEQRNTGKGNPNAVLQFGVSLNNRQEKILELLPNYDSTIVVSKKSINMSDLSALTAKTGNEFAMFTNGNERLIVRGNASKVNIDIEKAKELAEQGYRWSGHTHPGIDFLSMQPSDGDYSVLLCFNQENSVIYNSKGEFRTFEKRG